MTRCARVVWLSVAAGWSLLNVAPLAAQTRSPPGVLGDLLERPLVILNARVLSMDGWEEASAAVLVRGGKIERVARSSESLDIPLLARRIDAGGRTLTPGLIDVQSGLGVTAEGRTSNEVRGHAFDAFDRYSTEPLLDAIRHGITSVYVGGSAGPGIGGTGTVIRLVNDPGESVAIGVALPAGEAASFDLGSTSPPLVRLRCFAQIRGQLIAARAHQEALERYRIELEEYEKQLAAGATSEASGAAPPAPEVKPVEPPTRGPRRRRDRTASPADEPPPAEAPLAGVLAGDGADEVASVDDSPSADEPPGPRGGASSPDPKKPEKIKKPAEPRSRPDLEALFPVLDRSRPVRVRADRSADISNALDLAREFDLDMILEGGAEAHRVLEDLRRAEVSVVLADRVVGLNGEPHPTLATRYSLLREAGVRLGVGSGAGDETSARHVLIDSQRVGKIPDSSPLARVTHEAASLLRVANQIGRVRAGLLADLVLWSADPDELTTRVDLVIVGGRIAYDRAADASHVEERSR